MAFCKTLMTGAALFAAVGIGAATTAHAVDIKLEPYVTGVNTPLAMVQPAGDDRQFIIEQFGKVRVIDGDGNLLPTPFLDIRNKIVTQWHDFDERGLLGLAFHPDFANNGKFYVAYSTTTNFQGDLGKLFWWDHTNTVEEYTVSADDPNVANLHSGRIISEIDWPQFNHNGHWIGFGPDGMLYISTGDGGYANDWGIGHNVTEGNGQDLSVLHGKILRVDVDNPSDGRNYGIPADNPFVGNDEAAPEIWAYGLRNPWRCSFDMGGDNALFCGDVQQNSYEEIDIVSEGDNLGWRVKEATHCFDYTQPDNHPADCDSNGMVDPILEYPNCTAKPDGCLGISVTGGYVYRGAHSDWDGKYIFGDWSKGFAAMDGQIFIGSEADDGTWSMEVANVTNMDGNTPYILAFGQDANGEVYALTSITTGPNGTLDTIYKVVPAN
ncbi:PQQ-dependent sugar dehydrogenase [Phaeobacter marinintestinus]|uniref:PQQ-dependent sugar dehydrogenase n=1 Tax=Falsiphaeobacter marinintestinus TaxID=1492905 RepID=UPI0011B667ED|nr:PQQ-dependent sugar dehydrogenase [Phaeobacter marinintestinus]